MVSCLEVLFETRCFLCTLDARCDWLGFSLSWYKIMSVGSTEVASQVKHICGTHTVRCKLAKWRPHFVHSFRGSSVYQLRRTRRICSCLRQNVIHQSVSVCKWEREREREVQKRTNRTALRGKRSDRSEVLVPPNKRALGLRTWSDETPLEELVVGLLL